MERIDALISYFERARDLSHFAKEEVAQFHSGQVSRISTNEELRKRFGMRRDRLFRDAIQGEGVGEARREVIEQIRHEAKEHRSIVQSTEWAWMIGVMAGGGHNSLRVGTLTISEYDEDFLRAVKSTGERLMGAQGFVRPVRTLEDGTQYRVLTLHESAISAQLGDLRRDRWPQAIIEKHPWILRNNSYIASFLGGVFDTRGYITSPEGVFLSSSYPSVVNFLSELLVTIGVENPKPRYKNKAQERLTGVGIYNLRDMKVFAGQVHSKRSAKEADLEALRQRKSARSASKQMWESGTPKPKISTDNVIQEWLYLRELLGHTPRSWEIQELKKQGKTKYSVTVYINRFGDGNFVRTTQAIQNIAIEQGRITAETATPQSQPILVEKQTRAEHSEHSKADFELLFAEYKKARAICLKGRNRLPTIKDIAELRQQGVVSYSAHTLANYFGERSFVQARQRLEALIRTENASHQPEAPLPKIRVYARRGVETYNPGDQLIEEYRKAREICLRENGRLPLIHDISRLRKLGVVNYTAHTLANYFGDRSYPQAVANLESILENQTKAG